MSKIENNVENLLIGFRNDFLAEIPDRCESIEESILAMEDSDKFASAFDELYRSIHSLKGSGGTHGLPVITSICHQFEDVISIVDVGLGCANATTIDTMLKYNDLLKATATNISNESVNNEDIYIQLERLKLKAHSSEYSCMLLDQSNLLSKVIVKDFVGLPVNLSIMNNGLVALERLLQEKFDFLITSKELPVLNGVAVISALRNSDSKNANIPCIITTSTAESISLNQLAGVTVIKKDKLLGHNIVDVIKNLIG